MSDATNGNGTPTEDDPKEEKSTQFRDQLDEELRALRDPNLSHGAARLFLLIVKLSWKPAFGGRYNGRVGSLALAGPELARQVRANPNSFYRSHRTEKRDDAGHLMRSATDTPGWIERLVSGGYLWISKHKIPNIPEDKWLNVYNVTCLVPKQAGSGPAWFQGNWGSNTVARGSDFSSKNGSTGAQPTETGPASPAQTDVPTQRNRVSQPPATVSAHPAQPCLATPRNRVCPPPATVSGNPAQPCLANGENSSGPPRAAVGKKKTGVPIPDFKSFRGGKRPPGVAVEPAKLEAGAKSPAPHPEMVWWEKQWWFESKLHRQLKLLDEGIASAQGEGRKRLRERRHSLLVALGVAVPKTAAPTKAAAPVPDFKLPPKAEWQGYVAQMREAAR